MPRKLLKGTEILEFKKFTKKHEFNMFKGDAGVYSLTVYTHEGLRENA